MEIEQHYALFRDKESEIIVIVESFEDKPFSNRLGTDEMGVSHGLSSLADGKEFDVRIGTLEVAANYGKVSAKSSEELNEKLEKVYGGFLNDD